MLWVGIRRRLLTSTSQELNSWIWYVASVGGGGGKKKILGPPPPPPPTKKQAPPIHPKKQILFF